MPADKKSQIFEKLITEHSRLVRRYALRLMGDAEEAEELFQDTWIAAYKGFDNFKGVVFSQPGYFRLKRTLA